MRRYEPPLCIVEKRRWIRPGFNCPCHTELWIEQRILDLDIVRVQIVADRVVRLALIDEHNINTWQVLLRLFQNRHFSLTWRTPCRPKINYDRTAVSLEEWSP